MDAIANEIFNCYCGCAIPGRDLSLHFERCSRRQDDSSLSHLISRTIPYLNTASLTFFAEMELQCELTRLQHLREELLAASPRINSPITPQPKPQPAAGSIKPIIRVVSRKCSFCTSSSNLSQRSCQHYFCEEHAQIEGCPECCIRCKDPGEKVRLECGHVFCLKHFQAEEERRAFEKQGEMVCFECKKHLLHTEIKKVLGEAEFDRVMMKLAVPEGWSVAKCKKCNTVGAVEPAEIDYRVKDAKGRVYSQAAAECYARYRFTCPECRSTQCANCEIAPYHDGMTCDQNKQEKCRYCEERPVVSLDTCDSPECQSLLSLSCKRVLTCGHRCFGVANEPACPRCLEDSCCKGFESGSEFCSLCGSDKYRNKPVVILNCSHILHYACLKESLAKRWSTSRITFNFAKCPLCKEWALPISNEELYEEVMKYYNMYQNIRDRGMERLRVEPEENKRIRDPTDKNYYGMPERYVMDRFCFYECFKCREVYFGGKKECEGGEDRHQNPEEFLCPNCTASNQSRPGSSSKSCPQHGIDFIEYKCRFCCSIAIYYCWGTTHFCEACHKRHNGGDYLTDKKPEQLPKCPGRFLCPLKVDHPPNGKEFVLGCGLCRKQ